MSSKVKRVKSLSNFNSNLISSLILQLFSAPFLLLLSLFPLRGPLTGFCVFVGPLHGAAGLC